MKYAVAIFETTDTSKWYHLCY